MRHIVRFMAICCLLPILAGCAAGLASFNKGQRLEEDGKLDEAVMKYAEAAAANPEKGEFRMRFLTASTNAARAHLKKGDEFLSLRKLDDALNEYQASYALDPSLARAGQMMDQVAKLVNSRKFFKDGEEFETSRKPREALASYKKALELDPANLSAKKALDRILKTRRMKLDGFELNLKSTKPITLKFRDAKIKEVFNILTQLSGINFVFDEGVKDQNVTIMLENATFQQALEILTGINKLAKKVLNESTIILYPKTPDKNKQYEDLRVETFQLNKLDAKKAVNLIRTMIPAKKIYVNEDLNALVMRDTPDSIEIARKILEANDLPDAELVLEVEIVEISKKNEDNFGLVLSKYQVATAATTPAGQFLSDSLNLTNSTTTTPATTSNLLNTFTWRGFGGFMTVPNASFNFAKTLSDGQTLANPRIRIKNREKSKFNVGTRIPITTTSSPIGGGVSVNVQYIDVGVKMNAEPTVQLNDDISIKLSLEVSNELSRDKVGDASSLTTVVTIGTRNLDTVLSLKDGETSIIGGLIQDNRSTSKQTISILGDIPIIGPLLTGSDKNNQKSELVLAITPHIVRGITAPDPEVASFWSGKEDDPSPYNPYGSFVQEPEFATEQPAQGAPAAMPAPAMPAPPALPAAPGVPAGPAGMPPPTFPPVPSMPAAPLPAPGAGAVMKAPQAAATIPGAPGSPTAPAAALPVVTPVTSPLPVPDGGAVMAAPTAAAPAARPAQGPAAAAVPPAALPPQGVTPPSVAGMALRIAAPPQAAVNDLLSVTVTVGNASGLFSAPFILTYDPAILEFVEASEGNLLKSDGKKTVFQFVNPKQGGVVTVNLSRIKDSGGVSGSGVLASLAFRVIGRGIANLGFSSVHFTDPAGKTLDVMPFNTIVNAQ
ncbi:MAG TPA: cohesin domain-containing protein [Geobacteraceae bacterium]